MTVPVVDPHGEEHIRISTELEVFFKGKKKEQLKQFYALMLARVMRDQNPEYLAAYHKWSSGDLKNAGFIGNGLEQSLNYDLLVATAVVETWETASYLRGYVFQLLRAGVPGDEILGKAKTLLG